MNSVVTILVPVYNHPDFLDDCLYSILRQDYQNLEIVIKDDFSADIDGIVAVVRKYERLFNLGEKFKFVRNETNQGYVQNKHDGVANYCTGEYCLIMDHDDFFLTDRIIGLYVREFEASDRLVVVSAGVDEYYQNKDPRSPTEIIADNSCRPISEEKKIIDGNEYFLGFWNKFGPRHPVVTMFDRQLALERNWPNVECNDQSIPLLLSPGNKVAIFDANLAGYRKYDSSVTKNVHAEMSFVSHTAIADWIDCARVHSNIPWFSLFIWRLKTVILKDSGPVTWLLDKSESELNKFLMLLKKYNYLNYFILKFLNPQMIAYDYKKAGKCANRLIRLFLKVMIGIRWVISKLILKIDRILHDPEYRHRYRIDKIFYDPEYRSRFRRYISRRIFGRNRASHEHE